MSSSIRFLSSTAKRLQGKVALITGGASGIGAATARLFSEHGAKVVIADINDELGQRVCDKFGPNKASFIHCEVTDEAHVRNAVDATISKYGKLDIMFNNAGITGSPKKSIIESEKMDFERVLSVNVTGVFLGTKHAARVMIPARRGAIINTSSVASVVAGLGINAYTTSKHAVVGLTKNAAVELGQFGILVNSISPYAVPTPMTSYLLKMEEAEIEKHASLVNILRGVSLKAEDIAEAALYLGSDESKFVTGHNLIVDGGFTITNPTLGPAFPS